MNWNKKTLTKGWVDIDHLTRVLVLCGSPTEETMTRITSQEVNKLKKKFTIKTLN